MRADDKLSEAIQLDCTKKMDCLVASLLAMTVETIPKKMDVE
jgi:hypothetical protein